jgi:heme/copper-type cytochrome/quinol oxidase subunit 2
MDPTALFGLGISGFTIAMICISVICTLVITVVAIAIPFYFYRNNQKRAEQLMSKGTQGEATILALQDTGTFINNNPQVRVTLEIRMPMYPTYQITKTMTVPLIRLSQVQTGSVVQVMVDMSDPTNPNKVGLLLK